MWLIDRRLFAHFDYLLLFSCLAVVGYGFIVLYSAGYDPDSAGIEIGWFDFSIKSPAFARQIVSFGLGLSFMFLGLIVPPLFFERYAYVLYGIFILLLLVVFPLGHGSHGAVRWLSIAGMRFQPSEFMKIGIILGLSRYLSRCKVPAGGFGIKGLVGPALLTLVPMVLIVEQPDLGTALVVGAIGGMLTLFVGIRWRVLLLIVISAILISIPTWNFYLKPYQQTRVLTLLNPAADPQGSGYHVEQSKIAVGSGMLGGKGLLKGTQTQLHFLPEHTTDFIFSVLAEELGFAGSITLLLMYLSLLVFILRNAQRSRDTFNLLVCVGVAGLIFFQVFVNIGMVIGILPVVGITLPLFSYGGSSLMTIMFGLGVVLGASMRRFLFMQN